MLKKRDALFITLHKPKWTLFSDVLAKEIKVEFFTQLNDRVFIVLVILFLLCLHLKLFFTIWSLYEFETMSLAPHFFSYKVSVKNLLSKLFKRYMTGLVHTVDNKLV